MSVYVVIKVEISSTDWSIFDSDVNVTITFFSFSVRLLLLRYVVPPEQGKRLERLAKGR